MIPVVEFVAVWSCCIIQLSSNDALLHTNTRTYSSGTMLGIAVLLNVEVCYVYLVCWGFFGFRANCY